ncbi:MAG: hypothetical protein KIT84_20200 [Labilithrix sp.]|nr:hypothetical protein [Labilithrix sp.]MCW5813362.1 hypothetical protein [Labilithrix sp.]
MGSTSTASQDDKRVAKVVERISHIKVLRGQLDPAAGVGYEVSFLDGKRTTTRLFSAVSVLDARPANGEFFTASELASQVDRYRARELAEHIVRRHERVSFQSMTHDEGVQAVLTTAASLLPALDAQLRAARRQIVLDAVAAVGDDVDLTDIETAWHQSHVDRLHGG